MPNKALRSRNSGRVAMIPEVLYSVNGYF